MDSSLTLHPREKESLLIGEMSERSKEHAWKACIRFATYRGFESLSLRNEPVKIFVVLNDEMKLQGLNFFIFKFLYLK